MENSRRTDTRPNRRIFLQTLAAGGGAGAAALLPGLPGPKVSTPSAYPDLTQLRAAHEKKGMRHLTNEYRGRPLMMDITGIAVSSHLRMLLW
jgi:hypothetical protein